MHRLAAQAGGWSRSNFSQAAGQANQRRLRVFVGTLVVALVVSLAFTWLRQPEYRAAARLEITPAVEARILARAALGVPESSGAAQSASPFLTEVQVLTSRPVLEEVAAGLARSGYDLSTLGPDPIAGMQSRVEATPVAGTNVVELAATAERPELPAPLINAAISVYNARLEAAYRDSSGEAMARADDEVTKLEGIVTAKRRDVEAFRIRNNIVSLERDENEVLARVRNLSTSLSSANDKVATAEGKLSALTESAATGEAVVRSRDDPTLANLEQRASQIREELRDLERGFTPDYMAKDPRVINQRTRLAELDRQIAVQRAASQRTALIEAKQELAGAQAAAARIHGEMASGRQEVAQFTARFNEYKARQEELAKLETAYQDAVQRRAKLEASERARMPAIKVLEGATTPQEPWRPLYWRDTALSVVGSLVLALLAMWLVELFNRPEPQPAVVLIQPQPGALLHEVAPQALGTNRQPLPLEATEPTLLPRQTAFPRELHVDEVSALLRAADAGSQVAMLLLLSGVSVDEALKLSWSDVDLDGGTARVGGQPGREVRIGSDLSSALAAAPSAAGSDLLLSLGGRPSTLESIDAQILCAALDAGIEDAAQVTSACLRHTYIAFLVRQGIRFADLTRLVGPLSAELLRVYGALSPPGAKVSGAKVDANYPVLRDGDVRASPIR